MNINIHKPFSISEVGKRVNNQDTVYPTNDVANENDRLFLVCDGVGGSNKGEVASSLACDAIQSFFHTFLEPDVDFDPNFIDKSIRFAEIRFDEYIHKNPSAKGMATTLCLLYFTQAGAYLTHAGDSRIYQFRNGEIIFKTEDHSLVNSMIKTGQINSDEAKSHPQKNVIYRAIQGTKMPVEIDITVLTDIQPGDVFFMCTDGVMEAMNDEELSTLFSSNSSHENITHTILENCREKSRDNYSAHLIPIQSVEKGNVFRQVMTSFLYAFV